MRPIVILAAVLSGTAPIVAQRPMPPRLEVKLVEAGVVAAIEERGLLGIADYVMGDGVLGWPGNGWVVGPGNAAEVLRHHPLADSTVLALEMLRLTMSVDSTTALVEGVAALKRPDVRPVRLGRYLAAWERVDGEWRLRLFLPVALFDLRETRVVQTRPPATPPVTATQIHAADSAFWSTVREEGIAAGFASAADTAAIWSFTGTGEIAVGIDAVSKAVRHLSNSRWLGRPLGGASSPDGSIGWAVGELVVTNPTDNSVASYSAYATLWQRGTDGRLRLRSIASVPRQ